MSNVLEPLFLRSRHIQQLERHRECFTVTIVDLVREEVHTNGPHLANKLSNLEFIARKNKKVTNMSWFVFTGHLVLNGTEIPVQVVQANLLENFHAHSKRAPLLLLVESTVPHHRGRGKNQKHDQ